jgi:hypothetical protein
MYTGNSYTRPDVRWKQRFNSYLKALQTLTEANV